MKVSSLINQENSNSFSYKNTAKTEKDSTATYKRSNSKTDSVEISAEASRLQAIDEKLSASSGKDYLGITKGSKENSYLIHFSDSAAVSRAVSRGYITVNGTKIELSDSVKKQLTKVDKKAQANRMQAYNRYIMQHELAVAQQQSETYANAAQDTHKALETASKMTRGKKVSNADEQALMEYNPQLYAMARIMAMLAKQKEQIEGLLEAEEKPVEDKSVEGVEWADFEWKSYENQLEVSFEGNSPSTGAVTEVEIDL